MGFVLGMVASKWPHEEVILKIKMVAKNLLTPLSFIRKASHFQTTQKHDFSVYVSNPSFLHN